MNKFFYFLLLLSVLCLSFSCASDDETTSPAAYLEAKIDNVKFSANTVTAWVTTTSLINQLYVLGTINPLAVEEESITIVFSYEGGDTHRLTSGEYIAKDYTCNTGFNGYPSATDMCLNVTYIINKDGIEAGYVGDNSTESLTVILEEYQPDVNGSKVTGTFSGVLTDAVNNVTISVTEGRFQVNLD